MSWTAWLERWGETLDWNYTHNCNGMANAVLYDDYEQESVFAEVFQPKRESWWKSLEGKSGQEGALFLDKIIKGLEAEPERFRAMNPDNGWGDYDSFTAKLKEMRDAVTEEPSKWSTHG